MEQILGKIRHSENKDVMLLPLSKSEVKAAMQDIMNSTAA